MNSCDLIGLMSIGDIKNSIEYNRKELGKIDPQLIGEQRYDESAWKITKCILDLFYDLRAYYYNDHSSKFSQNIVELRTAHSERVEKMSGSDDETASVSDSTISAEQTPEQAQLIYSEFFKGISNFGEHFQKLFDEKLTLPEGAKVVESGDILTITLPTAKSIALDPEKELSEEQFDQLNRNRDTEGLAQLNSHKGRSWDDKTIPKKPSNPELLIKNLTYFGSFGPRAAGELVKGKPSGIERKLVLQRSENTITFMEGGPSGLKSIEFLPGYEDRGGLVKINPNSRLASGDVYFGNDFLTLFELGKVN